MQIKEQDGFSARNSVTAVFNDRTVVVFGGQDSEKNEQFSDIYQHKVGSKELQHATYKEGHLVPAKRNSHTMV